MAAVIGAVVDQYNYLMSRADTRNDDLPTMSSPFPVIALVFIYVKFTKNWGQRLMKNRQAMECKNAMVVYNVVQILSNFFFFEECLRIIWIPQQHNLFCAEVDYSYNTIHHRIARLAWGFYLTKVLDLLDTVFMVLRKKNNQISFLHVYHHSGMVLATWVAAKFIPGGYCVFFATVNSFVHVVMYTYYLVTALYPQYKKNIWWKKHITTLQLVQFAILALHGLVNFFNPNCNFPKFIIGVFIPQDIFMLFMFWDFYKKAYLTPKKTEKDKKL